jgi:hypothetical protein
MVPRHRHGGAALLGGVISIAILATTLSAYYLTSAQLRDAHARAVEGRLAENAQQAQERISVETTIILGNISAVVANDGPIPIQVAYIAVINGSTGAVLAQNDTTALFSLIEVTVGESSLPIHTDFRYPNTGVYDVVVVTQRGTVARGVFPPPFEPVGMTIHLRQIGLLTIDILSFNYTSAPGGSCAGTMPWGAWSAGFQVADDECVVWRINFTNNDPSRDFYLDTNAHLFLMQAKSSNTRSLFLVRATLDSVVDAYTTRNVAAPLENVTAYSLDEPLRIPKRSWRWVYFYASTPGDDEQNPRGITPDQYAVWLLLSGWWNGVGGEPYGQNVPFVAVRGI